MCFYSNAFINFLMVGLERLVKMDFASCPCHPEMNLLFFAAYFVVHSLFSSALMLHCKSFMTMQRKVSALHLHRSNCCLDNASVL